MKSAVELILSAGRPGPLGATVTPTGVNFAVFSDHATAILVCLFDAQGAETHRFALPERDGGIWFGHISGIGAGQLYGLRAEGPYAPAEGHRFNANKLLIDPYARQITGHPVWNDALYGYDPALGPDSFSDADSAPYMPRCVVCSLAPATEPRPATPWERTVVYEGHVKGLTASHPSAQPPGSYAALTDPALLEHITGLGVTALELLPIHAFLDDRFLTDLGLSNYWGYQSIGFFAPEPRYLSSGRIEEVQSAIAGLHEAGLEVLLDVVYNHTGEGNELGPTLSFRGLDNASYYRLLPQDRSKYINDTGTGNTVNAEHPMVLRLILDSLRYWVEVMGADGFRFDLCATLGRRAKGFDLSAPFFAAIRQDPVLSGVKLIAEPWDIGPGGYQLGAFPTPFHEWNDKFRDGARRYWRGDRGRIADLADRLSGSATQFDHSARPATASINLITAHDGFTLRDLTEYLERHNEANGEGNRDGHGANYSDNFGVEGPSDDPEIEAARAQRRRNLLATLFLSQGTPMLLAGDEIANTQGGNNNAYAQDNETGWIDWAGADDALYRFTQRLIAFRQHHPILRQRRFLHSRERPADGLPDLFWWRADGDMMEDGDWRREGPLCAELRMASDTPFYAETEVAIYLIFNRGKACEVVLPPTPETRAWRLAIDTSLADGGSADRTCRGRTAVPAASVLALVLERADG
ncbi:MAG: glycogen debranching protein GlgX [Pseudomonadota bacterium]